MEEELGTDREAALADMRYSYIEELCADVRGQASGNPRAAALRKDRPAC